MVRNISYFSASVCLFSYFFVIFGFGALCSSLSFCWIKRTTRIVRLKIELCHATSNWNEVKAISRCTSQETHDKDITIEPDDHKVINIVYVKNFFLSTFCYATLFRFISRLLDFPKKKRRRFNLWPSFGLISHSPFDSMCYRFKIESVQVDVSASLCRIINDEIMCST